MRLLLLLALSSHAWALNLYKEEWWARLSFTVTPTPTATPTLVPTNTPTVTPTLTPLPVPVLKGNTLPISTHGNSHCAATYCEGGTYADGWRPGFLAAANASGLDGYFVGAHLNTFATPQVQNSYTNCVGGTKSWEAYADMVANLGSLHPNNSGLIIIQFTGNDGFDPNHLTRAQEAAAVYASITLAAAAPPVGCPGCRGLITNDFAVAYGITPSVEADIIAGVHDGWAQAQADGFTAFCFVDTSSMVQANWLCSDASHLNSGHQAEFGGLIWNEAKTCLGY